MSSHLTEEEKIERARTEAANQLAREKYHALKMARIASFLLLGERHEFQRITWEEFAAFVVDTVFKISGVILEPPEHDHTLDHVSEREYYRSGLVADAISAVLLADEDVWRTLSRTNVRLHREDLAQKLATSLGVDVPILDHQRDQPEPEPESSPILFGLDREERAILLRALTVLLG